VPASRHDRDVHEALLARGGSGLAFTGFYEEEDAEGGRRRWRVWRRGRLARIEDPPGTVTLIAGDRTYWRKWPTDPAVVVFPRSPDHDEFELSLLTMLDPEPFWRGVLTQDPQVVMSSLESTDYEGRAAWRFRAPDVKGGRPTLTVDAELGLVLRAERADLGALRAWSQVRTDLHLSDDLFRHDGPWQLDDHHAYPAGWLPE